MNYRPVNFGIVKPHLPDRVLAFKLHGDSPRPY
jgi:hypothetical protein